MELSPMHFNGPPEYYTDVAKLAYGPFGFIFDFGLQTAGLNEAKTQAVLRMSPQHTLVFYQLLKKYLREFEEKNGKINIHEGIFTELQIEREV
jgi:hypothetical protein